MLLEVIKYAIYGLMIVCGFVLLITLFRNGKPLKTLFWSGLSGVIALIAVAIAGHFTIPLVQINGWSLLCSFGLGVPGVILMVVIHQIWNL